MSRVVGLTGSIGMGKSHAAALFHRLGLPVFDADAEVHRLQGPGGALVSAIERLHPGTTGPAGVDRARLGRQVLGDRAALRRLERLIHPRVAAARRRFLRRHAARPVVVVDIPLLFETGGWRRVDSIVVVSAPAWMQRRRVLARPGATFTRLAQIRALQWRDARKRALADWVVPTARPRRETAAAIRRIAACEAARARR